MIVLAFLTYPAFGGKNFKPARRCWVHPLNYARTQVVSLSAAQNDRSKEYPSKIEQSNSRSYAKQANEAPSSDIESNAEIKAQYKFFSEQLGTKTEKTQKQAKDHAGRQDESSCIDSNIQLDKVHEQGTTEVEVAKHVHANPADYDLFDQLLQSTGGTGRKPIKGSKPFTSVVKHQLRSQETDWKSVSRGRRAKKQNMEKRLEDDSVEVPKVPGNDNREESLFDEPNSISPSYDLMREEFGEGFHGLGQKPISHDTNHEESDKTPPMLQERPRRPGYMENARSSGTAEVPVGSDYKMSNPSESMFAGTGKPSETAASTAASYDFMREEFGIGFHDVRESQNSGDVEKPRSGGNAPPALRDRPKRDGNKDTANIDTITKSAIPTEIRNPNPGQLPKLNAPPRRRLPETGQDEPSVSQLTNVQDGSELALRKSAESSLQKNKDTDPSPPSLRNAAQGTGGTETIFKDAEETTANANYLSGDNIEVGHSMPSVLNSGDEASNASGVEFHSRAADKMPLLIRPKPYGPSKDDGVYTERRFRGSQRLNSRGKQVRTNEKAYVLEHPKLIRAEAISSI